ncbi:MAG: hypothetical protein ACFB22_01650 [Rhodothalassiaceae bacterium]
MRDEPDQNRKTGSDTGSNTGSSNTGTGPVYDADKRGRQGELVFATARRRRRFLIYIGIAIALAALIAYLSIP